MEVRTAGDKTEKFESNICQRLDLCHDILKRSRLASVYSSGERVQHAGSGDGGGDGDDVNGDNGSYGGSFGGDVMMVTVTKVLIT